MLRIKIMTAVLGCAAVTTGVVGVAAPASAIVGGHPAGPYPSIASVQVARGEDPDHPRCVATLVDRLYAVTAAHCVTLPDATGMDPALFHLRIGSLDRTRGGVVVGVAAITAHPQWDWASGDDAAADVAVLRLRAPVPLPVLAIGRRSVQRVPASVAGWGLTENGATTAPARLRQVSARIVASQQCAAGGITAGELCIDGGPGRGPCAGDSGAPVTQPAPTTPRVLFGLVSRETTATCGDGPVIATDLTAYRSWIVSIMQASSAR